MKPIDVMIRTAVALRTANAHSYVTNFVINGISYSGFHPANHNTSPDMNPSILAAWSTDVIDDGWVGELDYATPDIICHLGALNANGNVPVEAGDEIVFQWNGWPQGHHGPVLTYMAYCGEAADACFRADKTGLEFFGIDAVGLLNSTGSVPEYESEAGIWATDVLIHMNHTYTVQVPPTLSPGNYVIRHEIIALHYAVLPDLGPQHYPQCFDVVISGGGTQRPEGMLGTELYGRPEDSPGLYYDLSQDPLPPYTMPGPGLMEGAVPSAVQDGAVIIANGEAMLAEVTGS